MRRRGFIVLMATIPTWATLFVLAIPFQKAARQWGFDVATPTYLTGIGDAALVGTLAGVFVLMFALNSWLKKRKLDERDG